MTKRPTAVFVYSNGRVRIDACPRRDATEWLLPEELKPNVRVYESGELYHPIKTTRFCAFSRTLWVEHEDIISGPGLFELVARRVVTVETEMQNRIENAEAEAAAKVMGLFLLSRTGRLTFNPN